MSFVSDLGREKMVECEIAVTISQLLGTEVGTDLQDTVLELLGTIAEIGNSVCFYKFDSFLVVNQEQIR